MWAGFGVADEDSALARPLRERMRAFYDSVPDYSAFAETNDLRAFWGPIVEEIRRRASAGPCRVLEFGAGRTGFGEFLGDLRERVTFHVQDVTRANEAHLTAVADRAFFGEICGVSGQYDVIFSTFVWEHLPEPRKSLSHLLELLAPNGCLILASPRYDLPGYVPPSARRLSRGARVALMAWLTWRRALVLFGGRPAFLVHTSPACLDGPWYRDADAVHWVSRFDLKTLGRGYRVSPLHVPSFGWKSRVWTRFCLLFVRIERHPPGANGAS